jgi:hypothetical protein
MPQHLVQHVEPIAARRAANGRDQRLCVHLPVAAAGRLISDDHGARAVARNQYQVRASSTVGVLTELLVRGQVTPEAADLYLVTLRTHGRMGVSLTSRDLLARNLGPLGMSLSGQRLGDRQ